MLKSTNNNKATYWTNSSISGLNFLSTQYSNHEFAPHSHESFAIGVVESVMSYMLAVIAYIKEARSGIPYGHDLKRRN